MARVLDADIAALRSISPARAYQMQIERATYADLVKQVKTLTEENANLKEDLAFFQTLMPSGGKEGGVAVNRFMVQNDALPGEFRYRLLLTQTGQRSKDFQGRLQFVINLQHDGKKSVMTLPAEDDKEARSFKLNFRFYQRVEGTFRVAPGMAVKGMQVRVFEGEGKDPRLTQLIRLAVKNNYDLKAAEANLRDLRVTVEPNLPLCRWLLEREGEQRVQRGFHGLPTGFVEAYIAAFPKRPQAFAVASAKSAGQTVAAMLFLRHGAVASYHIGWSNEEGRRLNAHNLLLWRGMEYLKSQGLHALDLGGLNTRDLAGISRFKIGAGGEVVTLAGTFFRP